jgi:drug/metabolite transporter (DMT)-like permease
MVKLMGDKHIKGHIAAFITIIIWGTTFISTKILLVDFKPIEILFFRFLLGLIALIIVCPKRLKRTTAKQEITFAAAGLCGICLYYLLENIALSYTLASNVGIIISIAPFFTAILSHIFMKTEERLRINFFLGFIVAMAGILIISFNGKELEIKPIGDILAVAAALVWAIYSLLTRKISSYGYNTIQTTKRVFAYGIVFMIPTLFFFEFNLDLARMANIKYLFNLIFLGLGASALCFVTWNYAVKLLGAVKTSVYIYMVPVITIVASAIVLREQITLAMGVGTALALVGLILSQPKITLKKKNE